MHWWHQSFLLSWQHFPSLLMNSLCRLYIGLTSHINKLSQIFSPFAMTAMINGFWITYFTYEMQQYSPLTPATLNKSPPSAVKRVLEGQANADTVQCFYWPNEKPLCVSRGLELRLGSLLSAFISVSFAISLSLFSPSLSPTLSLSFFLHLCLSYALSNTSFSNSLSLSAALLPRGAGEENVTRSN